MDSKGNRAWAEVNLDAIRDNLKEIRRITNPKSKILAVVKADAYGHGFLEVTRTLLENGADALAVACVSEAMQLRRRNITVPILILGYSSNESAGELIEFDIMPTVFDLEFAKILSYTATKADKTAKIDIKVDTGMSRLGFLDNEASINEIKQIYELPGIEVEGIFTHMSAADEKDESYSKMQFERFMNFCGRLEDAKVYIPIKHICNSAGIISYPEMHLDMVRPGIILYGHYPSEEVDKNKINLVPAMSLRAVVVQVKEFDENTSVSYGRKFITEHKTRLAVLPLGYADGLSRALSGRISAIIGGALVPIVGNICMDQCMADVTNLKTIHSGDVATIFGSDNGNKIDVEEVAKHTINYELLCVIGKRIPRIYMKDNKVAHILDYMV